MITEAGMFVSSSEMLRRSKHIVPTKMFGLTGWKSGFLLKVGDDFPPQITD